MMRARDLGEPVDCLLRSRHNRCGGFAFCKSFVRLNHRLKPGGWHQPLMLGEFYRRWHGPRLKSLFVRPWSDLR